MKKLLLLGMIGLPILAQSGFQIVDLDNAKMFAAVISSVSPPALPGGVGITSLSVRFDGINSATDHAIGFETPAPNAACPMIGARVTTNDRIQVDFLNTGGLACTPAPGSYKIVILRLQ